MFIVLAFLEFDNRGELNLLLIYDLGLLFELFDTGLKAEDLKSKLLLGISILFKVLVYLLVVYKLSF